MARILTAEALPFFTARFWRLLGRTLQIKWKFARRGGERYTDYLAEFYSRANNPYWEAVEDKWASIRGLMVMLAELEPEDTVLDLATGVGFQAAAFSGLGHPTTGLDYIFARAQLAKERNPQPGLSWAAADAARLPFGDEAFDVISVSLALHDLPLPVLKEVLLEICRVARRRVVIAEPRLPGHPLLKLLYLGLAVLFDESLWIKDYLHSDLPALIGAAHLKVVASQPCFHGILVVYACEPLKTGLLTPVRQQQSAVNRPCG